MPVSDPEIQNALVQASSGTSNGDIVQDLQNVAILVAGISYFVFERRPRGDANMDLVDIRRSTVQNANMGVFSKAFIAKDTLVGKFPGYLMDAEKAVKSKVDEDAIKNAKKYMWCINEEQVLDPTNEKGGLELELSYLGGLVKVNTAMARVNEPPPRGDCNLFTKVESNQVFIYAERDIFADEELFLDYGSYYDRSDYADDSLAAQARQDRIKKRLEEEEYMTLRPIVDDVVDGKPSAPVDTDTTNPEGFLAGLGKKEVVYRDSGIISPEEGAQMFGEFGVQGLTGNAEEREFMKSIKQGGKGSGPGDVKEAKDLGQEPVDRSGIMDTLMGGASIRGVVDNTVPGASNTDVDNDASDDVDLMADLVKQMGTDNAANLEAIPDLQDAMAQSTPGQTPAPSASKLDSQPEKGSDPPSAPPGSTGQTLLSREEAEDLQRRVDNLTDEQLERVFSKMRNALGQKASEDMVDALEEARRQTTAKGKRNMPRATPVDSDIRSKYDRELNAIEDELEKIYNDPLGVWQELITNPEKFEDGSDDDALTRDEELG